MPTLPGFIAVVAIGALALPSSAQIPSNLRPGTDVELGILGSMQNVGTDGTTRAFAMSTTSCNKGTVNVPWLSAGSGNPMNSDHPFIAFMLTRELDGKFEQISNYSHVKHGFFALSSSQCTPCQNPSNGTFLGVGCSDTYGIGNNGDNFWLGPAAEIDPWLGDWEPCESHFDVGIPDSGFPANQNCLRSPFNTGLLGPAGNRVLVEDSELNIPGADYYFSSSYIVRGEPKENRNNNMRYRGFSLTGSGPYGVTETGPTSGPTGLGSVLDNWTGATVTSGVNGGDDGHFYVGAKVTGPVNGIYHYEYAVHNSDNSGGGGALRIPICEQAGFANIEFGDIDDDAGNDWTVSVIAGELVFETGDNPLRWNSIYNFSFDSTAGPDLGDLYVDEFTVRAGADPTVTIKSFRPSTLYNIDLGPGCSNSVPPALGATGSPSFGKLGNASFGLEVTGADSVGLVALRISFYDGTVAIGSCDTYIGLGSGPLIPIAAMNADGGGVANFPTPIPNSPALEGAHFNAQGAVFRAAGGPLFGDFDSTNGLRVRMGSSTLTPCPPAAK